MDNVKNIRKNINLIESVLTENNNSIELTDYTLDQINELQKLINRHWPNVTYKGMPILYGPNSFYEKLNDVVEDGKPADAVKNFAQETYLGYDMKKDLFYSGYDGDPWESEGDEYFDERYDETNSALFIIKVKNNQLKIISHEMFYSIFYRGPYQELKNKNKNIVDLRLD